MRDFFPDRPTQIDDPHAWLETNAAAIPPLVGRVARRQRLRKQDADELLSMTWAHLMKDDYRVLRSYRGTSAIGTYLTVVVARLLLDMRTKQWGKWRPSAAARRQGPDAVRFERLVQRERVAPEQARTMLGQDPGQDPAGGPIVVAAEARPARRWVGLEFLTSEASPEPGPLDRLLDQHRAVAVRRLGQQLAGAVRRLPDADQELIRLRHGRGLRIVEIASRLGIEPRKLYPRLAAIHQRLHHRLTRNGVSRSEVIEVIAATPSRGREPVHPRADRATTLRASRS